MGGLGDNPHKVLALGEGEYHWSPEGQRLELHQVESRF